MMAIVNVSDEAILEEMADGRRHNAPELAALTGLERSYLNNRLRHLLHHDLVESVEHSQGMYLITADGREVLE